MSRLDCQIVTADIGGTHARFALATISPSAGMKVSPPVTLKTGEHASFETALAEFQRQCDAPLPRDLALSFAGPVDGAVLKLTNNPWAIRPAQLAAGLGLQRLTIVNDFGAVAHAAGAMDGSDLAHLCGPDEALPAEGVITILGPGTGLGVAALHRTAGGHQVIETEGGHVDFAPLDTLEDRILTELRLSFRRVSTERLISGRGLLNIYGVLATLENKPVTFHDERALWSAALEGTDLLAVTALDRFCLTLGSVAGDLALAQGARAVVIAGGLGLRLAQHLPQTGFRDRFTAKGRFERRLDEMPVKVITHPQPGLLGAAAAWVRQHGNG